jgi:hypothetical protein
MNDDIPEALPLGPDDEEKRTFAWQLMKTSNDVVVGFAKLMAATAMTAIGVLLSLASFIKVGSSFAGWESLVLAISCFAFLAATIIFSHAVRGRSIDISPDDYDDVVEQYLSAARRRQRVINAGLAVLTFATTCGLVAVLAAVSSQR